MSDAGSKEQEWPSLDLIAQMAAAIYAGRCQNEDMDGYLISDSISDAIKICERLKQ